MIGLAKKLLMPVAKRFVAGEDMDAAIQRTEALNRDGIAGLINNLGEHVTDRDTVEAALQEYDDLLDRIDKENLDASISLKPTHLGLEIDEEYCLESFRFLVRRAAHIGVQVWIDMESSAHTRETLDLYDELLEEFDNVGLCIQCYLRRSDKDIEDIIEKNGIVRLVKGAYNEPESIAYRDKEDVDRSYRELMHTLFDSNIYFAIGTHDPELVELAKELAQDHNKGENDFEFQFLKGVQEDLKEHTAAEGYTVSEYIPYGEEWLSYYWRRVMERKENLKFALTAIFKG